MLKWALNGFPPAGAAGLVPTSGEHCLELYGCREIYSSVPDYV